MPRPPGTPRTDPTFPATTRFRSGFRPGFRHRRGPTRRRLRTRRRGRWRHSIRHPHRAPAVPRARLAAAPPQARRARARSDHPRPGRAVRRLADRARGPRRRPLPRPGDARSRRPARRIPRDRVRQGRPPVRRSEEHTSELQSPMRNYVCRLRRASELGGVPVARLTERRVFPERAAQPRGRGRAGREPEAIIRDLGERSEGSPIVHEDHGVGRYRGLVTLEAGGQPGEYLEIEYAKGDRLYVPVAQLHLVSRYSGASPETAPLHSLGGEQWTKARRKAAEKVRDVAAELLDIQAKRQARAGLAIDVDRAMYEPFAATFPFEETPDQHSAIEAVIRDLSSSQPMDRVVCGDVGFGKTEVAVRAAFVAATAGRKVAVLVPTTLTAAQHSRNLSDRCPHWLIRAAALSRLQRAKENKAELDRLAEGRIDVIVGTHRLLQKDVRFKDLGLVIVDEEQRFGVRQKEALKAMRANVHLLTLTATPIPRTLNMAMAGLRDLAIITTPPAHRLAVQTFVAPWDDAQLREAFERELARGGQVYFLHNDVESIGRMQRQLSELVPEARIGIAHGQMPERELERVMLDFHKQRFNVLLCSTIIESGIDIPNANTIIINRADRFRLPTLNQPPRHAGQTG